MNTHVSKNSFCLFESQSGLAAILTVVIIGAVSLIIAKTVSSGSLDGVEMAYAENRAGEALAIAEGCIEETFRRFQLDENYSAENMTLALGNGECVIDTSADGNERIITVAGSVGEYYRRVRVDISIENGIITVNDWQEI